jgi:hypothetical protein
MIVQPRARSVTRVSEPGLRTSRDARRGVTGSEIAGSHAQISRSRAASTGAKMAYAAAQADLAHRVPPGASHWA